jgi:hypothetical protein
MKDYEILATSMAQPNKASYAVRAFGTMSDRPLFTDSVAGGKPGEALVTGIVKAVEELSGYLMPGSVLELRIHGDVLSNRTSNSSPLYERRGRSCRPTANPLARLREIVAKLRRKGVDVHCVSIDEDALAAHPEGGLLTRRASMSAIVGRA